MKYMASLSESGDHSALAQPLTWDGWLPEQADWLDSVLVGAPGNSFNSSPEDGQRRREIAVAGSPSGQGLELLRTPRPGGAWVGSGGRDPGSQPSSRPLAA